MRIRPSPAQDPSKNTAILHNSGHNLMKRLKTNKM
jgi:hypothetical protein